MDFAFGVHFYATHGSLMTTAPDNSKRRRKFQFSLGALMGLMTLACIGATWVGCERAKVQKRQVAMAAIENLGGRVYLDTERPIRLTWIRRNLLGDDLAGELRGVDLRDTEVTDADLVYVEAFPSLRWLDLAHTRITDVGLSRISSLKELEMLNLYDTGVTDSGARNLRQSLPKMELYYR